MSINQITPIHFKKFPVGKFIGSTKLKYEWELVFENECLLFVGYYSKHSKSLRLFLNNTKLLESLNTDSNYSVTVKVEQAIFVFTKKKEDLNLTVDSSSFEEILNSLNLSKKKAFATWEEKKPKKSVSVSDPLKSLYHTDENSTTRKLVGVVFEWVKGVCVVHRLSQMRLADAIYLPMGANSSKGELGEITQESSGEYVFIDDSAEFYPHEFLYLFTQEVDENFGMIGLVNGEESAKDREREEQNYTVSFREANGP